MRQVSSFLSPQRGCTHQVHDFWHVLAGVPTSVLGELALKWFEMVHTGLPGSAVASLFGPLRLSSGMSSWVVPGLRLASDACSIATSCVPQRKDEL